MKVKFKEGVIRDGICVNVRTWEQLNLLLDLLDSMGYRWDSRQLVTELRSGLYVPICIGIGVLAAHRVSYEHDHGVNPCYEFEDLLENLTDITAKSMQCTWGTQELWAAISDVSDMSDMELTSIFGVSSIHEITTKLMISEFMDKYNEHVHQLWHHIQFGQQVYLMNSNIEGMYLGQKQDDKYLVIWNDDNEPHYYSQNELRLGRLRFDRTGLFK